MNKTNLACPVNVSDEHKICGTDNRTYESLCRMILEADGVDVWFDGPCNRSDCHGSVSVTVYVLWTCCYQYGWEYLGVWH